MSLFERLKNKREDLLEAKFDPSELLKAIKRQSDLDAAKDFKKDVGKEITPELKADQNRFFTDQSDSKTLKTKSLRFKNQNTNEKVTMWNSRNRILIDADGDDVAFLSGSGRKSV